MDRHHESSSRSNSGTALHPADFVRLLRTHIRWWAVPAVVFAVLAGSYSLVAPREWRATQALIVRPEAASVSEERLGKFADLSVFMLAAVLVGGFVMAPDSIATTVKNI